MSSESVFRKLRAKGEEVFAQVSQELMANPRFTKAVEGALRGKERLDQAAAKALKTMNVPTRTEFKKALRRIESLEEELASLKAQATARPAARRGAKRPSSGRRAK
jgi:polyhydroxyalkanoate synthesis regulator phasin